MAHEVLMTTPPTTLRDRIKWGVINAGQLLFLAVWSVVWMTIAILSCFATASARTSLVLARTAWSPGLLRIGGAKVVVTGKERVDFSKPAVFVTNHQSMIDIPLLFVAIPVNLHFIAKKELFSLPFLGWYMRASGMIPIDRKKGPRAVETLKRSAGKIADGANVLAFAEGTRSRTGQIAPFKKGAFMLALQAQVPVVPVAIEGARDVLPSDGFSVRPGVIKVAFGEPIITTGLTQQDRDDVMARAHDAVVQLNVELGGRGAEPVVVDLSRAGRKAAQRSVART